MPRSPRPRSDVPLSHRLPPDLWSAVAVASEQIRGEQTDRSISRSEAIRVLLTEAIRARRIPLR